MTIESLGALFEPPFTLSPDLNLPTTLTLLGMVKGEQRILGYVRSEGLEGADLQAKAQSLVDALNES